MRAPQYPSIELIQSHPSHPVSDSHAPRRRHRWKLFLATLVVALAVGLAVVYGRAPIYRATVSVLTVKPKAVDMPSAAADVQHVAIQERLLLGEELVGQLYKRLAEEGDDPFKDPDSLRAILSVAAISETNLLELRAHGEQPALLQRVVNAWAESYETFRLEEIRQATGRTTAELKDERQQIQKKIEAARAELREFREAHDIVSLQRDENRELSALRGLNASLNKARERLVEARSRKAAIDEAVARGETVIPNEQKSQVARLRAEIARSDAQLAQLQERYTDLYLSRDPKYKDLPLELEEKRQALAAMLAVGRETIRDEVQQAVAAARLSVATLEKQLDVDQARVQLFTERFKEFKSLEEGLAGLESLVAERDQRLAQIDVRNQQKFPPIKVVEWAQLPSRPIAPDYERDLMIALAAALALALFVTWLAEYLGGRPGAATPAPILGVRISDGSSSSSLAPPAGDPRLELDRVSARQLSRGRPASEETAPALEGVSPRQLTAPELERLLESLDPSLRALAAVLLSGVAPYELALLDVAAFDQETRRIKVPGTYHREIPLDAGAWSQVEPLLEAGPEVRMALLAGLDMHLATAARDAGVTDPPSVTAQALWHTYVAYLVEQGIDNATLAGRVGPIPTHYQSLFDSVPPLDDERHGPVAYTHPALSGESGRSARPIS